MTADLTPRTLLAAADPSSPESRIPAVGEELVASLRELLASIPSAPRTPTRLANRLAMSRVITSRMLGSLACGDVLESLQRIPGPESLRAAVAGAEAAGASPAAAARSLAAITAFASLIRADFGTRGALNTTLGVLRPSLRAQCELSSRYQIHKGMRDVLGIGAESWVLTAMIAPSSEGPGDLDLLRVEGALGVERSKPRANLHLRCATNGHPPGRFDSGLEMGTFCPRGLARTERIAMGAMQVERLAESKVGRSHAADLLAASRERVETGGSDSPWHRAVHLGTSPDVPARALLIDILVHERLRADRPPIVTASRRREFGEALANGPGLVAEPTVELLAMEPSKVGTPWPAWPEWPQQSSLLEAMAGRLGDDLRRFSHHRLRLAHPIPGFVFEVSLARVVDPG